MIEISGYLDKHEYVSPKGIKSTIYLMDCKKAMPQYPARYFDLACVDPPYDSENILGGHTAGKGGGLAKAKLYDMSLWKQSRPNPKYFDDLYSISKNQIIWGANHLVSLIKKDSSGWIFWDKKNGNSSFSDGELAFSSFNVGLRVFSYTWAGFRQQNMRNKEEKIHPTQKPVALYDWLFFNYAKPGQMVIDTHVGSGSSRIAADIAGIHFTGFEIIPTYFKDSIKRFENYTAIPRIPFTNEMFL